MRKILFSILVLVAFLGSQGCSATCAKKSDDEKTKPGERVILKDAGPLVTCPFCGLKFYKAEASSTMKKNNHSYFFKLNDHHDTCLRDPGLCSFLDGGAVE